jgi:hypothetical protein
VARRRWRFFGQGALEGFGLLLAEVVFVLMDPDAFLDFNLGGRQ